MKKFLKLSFWKQRLFKAIQDYINFKEAIQDYINFKGVLIFYYMHIRCMPFLTFIDINRHQRIVFLVVRWPSLRCTQDLLFRAEIRNLLSMCNCCN